MPSPWFASTPKLITWLPCVTWSGMAAAQLALARCVAWIVQEPTEISVTVAPRLGMTAGRNYWTPQILPLNSPFHRPLTPNGLLGSVQRTNGPTTSRCPEADANLFVPFTIFAVAL